MFFFFFFGHVATNINAFLWEMLCKGGSGEWLGSIVLMETRCRNDRVSEQLLLLPTSVTCRAHLPKALSFSPSSSPAVLSFEL